MHTLVIILIAGFLLVMMAIAQTPSSDGSNITKEANSLINNTSVGQYNQGELLVRFNPEAFPTNGSREASEMQANAAIGAVMITDFTSQGITGLELVRLPQGMTTEQGITYYQSIPTVMYAEVNAVYSIANTTDHGNSSVVPTGNTTPAEGLFVRYNATAFASQAELQSYANATNQVINATTITDYTPYGMPGLELVRLQPPMTTDQGLMYYRNVTNVLYAEPNVQYKAINMTSMGNSTPSG